MQANANWKLINNDQKHLPGNVVNMKDNLKSSTQLNERLSYVSEELLDNVPKVGYD